MALVSVFCRTALLRPRAASGADSDGTERRRTVALKRAWTREKLTGNARISCSPDGPKDRIAQFRPEGKGEFKTAAEGKLPAPGKDEVSIQCYNGPPDAEHWIRFDDFRIRRIED